MVSDKVTDLTQSSSLDEDVRKELAKKAVKKEAKSLLSSEGKWAQPPTAFDNLPEHEKPFPIEPFPHERQRLPFKMTEEDRMRRKTWLHSQELTDREPIRVPELERMIYNPVRRLYRAPTDKLFTALTPFIGESKVRMARTFLPKLLLGYVFGCVAWYNFKYNKTSWEEKKGFKLLRTDGILLPEEEKPKEMQKWDFNDNGFQSRKAFKGPEFAY